MGKESEVDRGKVYPKICYSKYLPRSLHRKVGGGGFGSAFKVSKDDGDNLVDC